MHISKERPHSTLAGQRVGLQRDDVSDKFLPTENYSVNQRDALRKTKNVMEVEFFRTEDFERVIDAGKSYVVTNSFNHITEDDLRSIAQKIAQAYPHLTDNKPESPTSPVKEPIPFGNDSVSSLDPNSIPGIVGEFAGCLAESLQVPFEMAVINALGATAVAIQRKIKVRVRDDFIMPVNLYAMAGLPPGERKSSTAEACKRPIVRHQKALQKEIETTRKEAMSDKLTIEETIKHARSKAARAKNEEQLKQAMGDIKRLEKQIPEIPSLPRLLADDVTPEQLAVLMAEQDQRIGILEAEGGIFEILAGRYSGGVPNMEFVLKAWSCESAQVDRRGREAVCLDDPHLTMCISPQPEVIQGLATKPGFRGRGLIGRFLFLMPESRLGHRKTEPTPMPDSVLREYDDMITGLLNIPWALNEDGEHTSYIIDLEPEAYKTWCGFDQIIEQELRPGGDYEFARDWAGKFPGQVIRLAGLLHASTTPNPHKTPIDNTTMISALSIARVLSEHAMMAFELMGTDEPTECAKAILAWIRRDQVQTLSPRDALEKVKGRFKTMDKVKKGLDILCERYYLRRIEKEYSGKGRPPSENYVVNPSVSGGTETAWRNAEKPQVTRIPRN